MLTAESWIVVLVDCVSVDWLVSGVFVGTRDDCNGGNRKQDKLQKLRVHSLQYLHNDERMHHYQRGRALITGLMVELRKIIETGRLVVVVMSRLVLLVLWFGGKATPSRNFFDLIARNRNHLALESNRGHSAFDESENT